MEPLKPTWVQPSHPDRLQVVVNEAAFTSKSLSLIDLPPFAVFSKLSFPPCTDAPTATYATVQTGPDTHLDLNSDLLYINHSCEPSLIFDTSGLNVLVGPKGLKKGDELTFFYPSTEWHMAQPFTCLCGTPSCRGTIAGARDMPTSQLEGLWINSHIWTLIAQRDAPANGTNGVNGTDGTSAAAEDGTTKALRTALKHAEDAASSARTALDIYLGKARPAVNGANGTTALKGAQRRGVTARELAGEMGGDTN